MKSLIGKHSVVVKNQKTSVSLEDDFWQGLHEIARLRGVSLSRLINRIDADREFTNLSSAIRLFVFRFFKEEQGRRRLTLEAAE
jgi:predicted DNA-binding ribbon-helix-helix protein